MSEIPRRAFDWIDSVGVEVDGGRLWCELGEPYDDLYCGTAGVLLACAEAHVSGLDTSPVAASARSRLLHLARRGQADFPDDGLFTGWAGVAFALERWSRAAHDAEAAAAARQVTARIADRVLTTPPDPARYTDIISGDAGILLAVLDEPEAAARLADGLVALAEPGPGGPQWRMVAGWGYLQPGFSHGTAGVAFALAAAGRALDRPDLVELAVRAAEGLIKLASQPDGWALPLTIPPRPNGPAVNFGWCHGPAGTARLFALLDEIDPRPQWRDAIDGCLQALRDSQIPARLYPGYWDNLARCCGTAGVGQFLLDRYQATGDPALLAWANELAADVLDRAVATPGGVTWSNTEHKKDPPDLPPEPGLMQGSAGIASWLARLEAYGAQGALTTQLTSAAHEVAESNEFDPPLLAI